MEQVLTSQNVMGMENQIESFFNRLETGEYKVVLLNGQTPILEDDIGIIDFILCDLNENSTVELIDNDAIVIHNENEVIKLTGHKRMSDGEIFARKYIDRCEYGDLIIKDSLDQVEFHEGNMKETKDYYSKCKDIVNIRTVPEDSEHYNMNWDCIIVKYKDSNEEIWQRA